MNIIWILHSSIYGGCLLYLVSFNLFVVSSIYCHDTCIYFRSDDVIVHNIKSQLHFTLDHKRWWHGNSRQLRSYVCMYMYLSVHNINKSTLSAFSMILLLWILASIIFYILFAYLNVLLICKEWYLNLSWVIKMYLFLQKRFFLFSFIVLHLFCKVFSVMK